MTAYAYAANLGSVALKQVRNTQFASNVQHLVDAGNGTLAPALISILSGEPEVTLDTGDLATVISNISVQSGLSITGGTDVVTVPFISADNHGGFEGTLAHTVITGTEALIVPKSFSASHQDQQGAAAQLMVAFRSSDGLVDPITITPNQTLSSTSYEGTYGLGPVALSGTQVNKVTQVQIDPGIEIVKKSYDGSPFPTHLSIKPLVQPKVTITFEDFDSLSTFTNLVTSIGSNTSIFFRKFSDGGSFVSEATASHIKFGLDGGLAILEAASAQYQELGNATLVFQGKTLTAATSQAIAI